MSNHIHTFPNGFRVIYEKSSTAYPISSIQMICDLGSLYETDNIRGVSHFIEHMCFKGTPHLQYIDLYKRFNNSGAYLNAYTTKRFTNYVIQCQDAHVKELIKIGADMLLNSVFNKTEFEKELKVVIEEEIQDADDNESMIDNLIDKTIYKGTPYENPVDCLEYHKKGSLKHKDVLDIYKLFYQPHNIILSIVTNLSFSTVLRYIESSVFMKKTAPKANIAQLNQRKCIMNMPHELQKETQYIIKPLTQSSATNLTIVFRTCSQYSSDKYVFDLLEDILGGYFSSKLSMLLREHNGLTYSSSTDSQYNENMGDFEINAITDHTKLIRNGKRKGVLPLIIDMINQLIKKGVTEEELTLVKNYIHGNRIMDLKDNKKACFHNAEYLLLYSKTNEYISYKHVYDRYYKTITREQIHAIIKQYFKKVNMTVFIAGQYIPGLATIQKECEKLVA